MVEKCKLCNEELKSVFLDKIDGTILKFKDKDNKLVKVLICSYCQKKHKENLRKEVEKSL
jgi:gluconate kinase